MAEKKVASVPYAVYEAEQVRSHKRFVLLIVAIIVLVVALVGTNIAWAIYESQFEYVTETTTEEIVVTQDNDQGDNNYIGHDGDING